MKRYEWHPVHNTFGIEAKARVYVDYESDEELQSLLPQLAGERILHVGGGSNLLFTKDFDGVVLHSCIRGMEVVGEDTQSVLVRAGAGEVWDDFVAYALTQGWSGVENLSLIPGEVGASAVQNIGAYGVEAKDVIERVEAISLFDGSRHVFTNADCQYGYRQSRFKHEWRGQFAITHVVYRLSRQLVPQLDYGNIRAHLSTLRESEVTPQTVRQAIISIRQTKLPDPLVQGNAGSFFMNPVVPLEQFQQLQRDYPQIPHYDAPNGVKIPAGWLIEQSGWKGKSLGKAAVHDRQALVLVNRGGATGADILALSETVCRDVKARFGIDIHPEVNVI